MKTLLYGLLSMVFAVSALAATSPDELLSDPVLEERARDLGKQLRCLVCQNQSIDDSDADLAKDLRALVRQRLVEGDSDEEVKNFLVARYGEFVLLKPPVLPSTYILWVGPLIFLMLGSCVVWLFIKRRPKQLAQPMPLSNDERAKLQQLEVAKD